MSHIPKELRYTRTHEWTQQNSAQDNTVTVGITEHAQQLLGDIVYVQLPNVGDKVNLGQEVGVIESVKAAADFYSPMTGEVVAVNDALLQTPELVNSAPYTEGWLFKLKIANAAEIDDQLNAEGYELLIAEDH